MAKLTISDSQLDASFERVLENYGFEGIGSLKDIIHNAHKYRWHDLRKDPDDLPDECSRYVLARHVGGYGIIVSFMVRSMNDIIAWREIEPFEESEK